MTSSLETFAQVARLYANGKLSYQQFQSIVALLESIEPLKPQAK